MSLRLIKEYIDRQQKDSDINQLMPILYEYGCKVNHITEFGLRTGNSTIALLYSKPNKLISYDIEYCQAAEFISELADEYGVDFRFFNQDVRNIEIEETDLLFIDTEHTYEQLSVELNKHHEKVRQYIIMHDTTTFRDELMPAIFEFIKEKKFYPERTINYNNGLIILKRY